MLFRFLPILIILLVGIMIQSTFSNASVTGLFSDDHQFFAEHYSNYDCLQRKELVVKAEVPSWHYDILMARYDCSDVTPHNGSRIAIARMAFYAPLFFILVLTLMMLFKNNVVQIAKKIEQKSDQTSVEVQCSICGAVLGEVALKEFATLDLNEQYCVRDQHQHKMTNTSLGHTVCVWDGCEASWQSGEWKHPA